MEDLDLCSECGALVLVSRLGKDPPSVRHVRRYCDKTDFFRNTASIIAARGRHVLSPETLRRFDNMEDELHG